MKNFYNSSLCCALRAFVCILAIVLMIVFSVSILRDVGLAEDYTEAYILCAPGNYVNVRVSPNTKSEATGYYEVGTKIYLDGKRKNGFLHCVNTGLENGDGWIFKGYIVYDEPEFMNMNATIVSKGRLAARKYVNGKRIRWLKPMATVKVYYWSEDWSVTNCGYVASQYLEFEGE